MSSATKIAMAIGLGAAGAAWILKSFGYDQIAYALYMACTGWFARGVFHSYLPEIKAPE